MTIAPPTAPNAFNVGERSTLGVPTGPGRYRPGRMLTLPAAGGYAFANDEAHLPLVADPLTLADIATGKWVWQPNPNVPYHDFHFIVEGADNSVANVRLLSWEEWTIGQLTEEQARRLETLSGPARRVGSLWIPRVLWRGTVTAGTVLGVNNSPVFATERFVDTITTAADYTLATPGLEIKQQTAPAGMPAWLMSVHTEGTRRLGVYAWQGSGPPTGLMLGCRER